MRNKKRAWGESKVLTLPFCTARNVDSARQPVKGVFGFAVEWQMTRSSNSSAYLRHCDKSETFPPTTNRFKIRAAGNRRGRMKNIVYFDLETQKSADEVGGWDKISRMGMSVGVTYSTANSAYRVYGEKQVDDLIRELQRADLVVGFNNLRFDYEVLHGYTTLDLRQIPTLDMLVDLQNRLQHRLSLDSIATATFGVEKTAEGMQAIRWYQRGQADGDRGVLLLRREADEAGPRIRLTTPAGSLPEQVRQKADRGGELVGLTLRNKTAIGFSVPGGTYRGSPIRAAAPSPCTERAARTRTL